MGKIEISFDFFFQMSFQFFFKLPFSFFVIRKEFSPKFYSFPYVITFFKFFSLFHEYSKFFSNFRFYTKYISAGLPTLRIYLQIYGFLDDLNNSTDFLTNFCRKSEFTDFLMTYIRDVSGKRSHLIDIKLQLVRLSVRNLSNEKSPSSLAQKLTEF